MMSCFGERPEKHHQRAASHICTAEINNERIRVLRLVSPVSEKGHLIPDPNSLPLNSPVQYHKRATLLSTSPEAEGHRKIDLSRVINRYCSFFSRRT